MQKLWQVKSLWSSVVGLTTFAILLPLSRLDYDSHHDGIMIASAVAQRQGISVHNGSFAQYGPFSTWLQSLFLLLGQPAAITLRVTNVLVLSLTAFLVSDLGRQSKGTINLSSWTTTSAAITWILLCDVFNWVPLLPWSSAIAQLLVVAGLHFLLKGLRLCGRDLQIHSKRFVFLSGLSWGLVIFTRINIAVVLFCAIALLWVYAEISVRAVRKVFRYIGSGVAAAVIVATLVLTLTNSLIEWWRQAIIWPLNWSSGIMPRGGLFTRVQAMFETMGFEVAIALILLAVLGTITEKQTGNLAVRQLFWFVPCGALFTFFAWSSSPTIWFAGNIPSDLLRFGSIRMNIFGLMFWLGITATTILLLKTALDMFRSPEDRAVGLLWSLFLLVSISGTVQILPVSDSRHFWWGMPLIIVALFHFVSQSLKSNLMCSLLLSVPVILLSISNYQLLPEYLQQSRTPAPSGSVAEKMLLDNWSVSGVPNTVNYFSNYAFLKSEVSVTDRALFIVRDGDLSTFDGYYHSIDRSFVHWLPVSPFLTRVKQANVVVLDKDVVSIFQSDMSLLGFQPVGENGSISIWRKAE